MLVRDAKLGAILLGVLLILYREYTPMVAADSQLEGQFGDQVSSLVHIEGHVNRMNQVVTEGFAAWEGRVQERLDRALRDTIALDEYGQQLELELAASSPDAIPAPPQFLTECASNDPPIAKWLANAGTMPAPWEQIVKRCIIEPIDTGADWAERSALSTRLLDARDDVNEALAHARIAFQIAPLLPSIAPTPTPVNQIECPPMPLVRARGPDPVLSGRGPDAVLPTPTPPDSNRIRAVVPAQSDCVEFRDRQESTEALEQEAELIPIPPAIPDATFAPSLVAVPGVIGQPAQIVIVVTQTAAGPTPSPTPTPVPLAETLDNIEWEVNWTAQIIESLPGNAIRPAPNTWWEQFTRGNGSLRSFRDNLLLVYSSPFGGGQTGRSLVSQELRNVSLPSRQEPISGAPGVALRPLLGDLAGALSRVRDEQERLQADIATQTAELEAAVPDFAKPVLAVARPRYLVLGYPFLVMAVGAYLAMSYTVLQRQTRQLRREYAKANLSPSVLEVGIAELPGLAFVAIAGVPILLLIALLLSNDWPQLIHGLWRWSHVGSLAVLVLVVLACTLVLRLSPKTNRAGNLND
jgi:hypothetical protein